MGDQVSLKAPEVRTYAALQIRDVDGTESGSFLEGRAVPYGAWADIGTFMESFNRGAFAKSIREAAANLPLLLWHDNKTFPVGRSERWTETDEGLDVIWKMDTKDDRAVLAAQKARDGFMTGLSVGFAPTPERDKLEIDDNGLAWVTRREARLLEVSLTPTPAYAGAQVSLVRTRQHLGSAGPRRSAEINSWKRYLEEVR